MKQTKNDELRELVNELVHAAIEGTACDMQDLVAMLARHVGVPYEALECATCGSWANAATARELGGEPLCDSCKRA